MADITQLSKNTESQKLTGKMKWLDSQGIGYILPDNCLIPEVYVTPLSLSSTVIKEGDCVKFNTKSNGSNPPYSLEAIDVVPFGVKCSSCKGFGHVSRKCPDAMISKVKCKRCDMNGHSAKNCDQKHKGWNFNDKTLFKSTTHNGRFTGWSSLFGGDGAGAGVGSNASSVVCVKKKEDVKRVEEVEDCFILDFDDHDENVGCIVCVEKGEDVKKVEEVEDCFILEFDPTELDKFSKLSLCVKSKVVADADDVSILAEKGKVACRDYPHPRHVCATYPFSKTAHELHCKMCYCYICDVPAPCCKWDEVLHCDATAESRSCRMLRDQEKKQFRGRQYGED